MCLYICDCVIRKVKTKVRWLQLLKQEVNMKEHFISDVRLKQGPVLIYICELH
jgi:hypothetical protein